MKQIRRKGAIVKIPLGNGYHTYARILSEASFAIYDAKTNADSYNLELLIKQPILFIVAVFNYAITKNLWKVIGFIPLENDLKRLPCKFIQDPLNPDRFEIYDNGKIRQALREECIGLERAQVWEPEQVEERIRDFYAGRKNKWIKLDEEIFK